jgi:hypothetical protein
MRLDRHLDLNGMPEIYFFYCLNSQHGETVRRAASNAPINPPYTRLSWVFLVLALSGSRADRRV